MKLPSSEEIEEWEESRLAAWAMKSSRSKGRAHTEEKPSLRTEFQRDRDRIIHCSAFRRLEYKTQVFVNHEGDHYRTRLTHTLEVSQIARSIGRALRLNDSLIEAIVLSHDLGHTPFGHSGEERMNELTLEYGNFKFEHNSQSLRVVDYLETRYPMFKGLNLTYEVREGIIKHLTDYDKAVIPSEFSPKHLPTLEAQIVNLADEIAYNNHDLDDGLASSMLNEAGVTRIKLWDQVYKKTLKKYPGRSFKDLKKITISGIISCLIEDLVSQTLENIRNLSIKTSDDVRNCKARLVGFSDAMAESNDELKRFLHDNLYKHSRVLRMEEKAKRITKDLFMTYYECIEQIPAEFILKTIDRKDLNAHDMSGKKKARIICDYIAGMTDRFAIDEHKKLFDPLEKV